MPAYCRLLLLLFVTALHDAMGAVPAARKIYLVTNRLFTLVLSSEVGTRRLLRASYAFADAAAKDADGEERVGTGAILAHYVQQEASTTTKAVKKATAAVETTGGKLKRPNQFVQKELDPIREYSLFNEFFYTMKLNPAEAEAKLFDQYGELGKKLAKKYAKFYAGELKPAAS